MAAAFVVEHARPQRWRKMAEWFRGAVSQICDDAMPRTSSHPRGRCQVYWWMEEVTARRRDCATSRRRYTRER
jgi:hypothetical protein